MVANLNTYANVSGEGVVEYGNHQTQRQYVEIRIAMDRMPKKSKCCDAQVVTSRKFGPRYHECLNCGMNPCDVIFLPIAIVKGDGSSILPK